MPRPLPDRVIDNIIESHRTVPGEPIIDNVKRPVEVDERLILLQADFGLSIARGLVPGGKCWASLAERLNVEAKSVEPTGVDVWHGVANQLPVPPSTGEQMEVVSSNAADNANGTGIQQVEIHYLDGSGDQRSEVLTLDAADGTTPVQTQATDIRFVNELHATRVGSNGVAQGDIDIRSVATPLNVFNRILLGGNYALTVSRMVPRGHSFFLKYWTATSTVQNKQVTLRIRATQHGGTPIPGVFLFLDSAVLEVSTYEHVWACPPRIPALSIIKVSAWANQVGTDVSAAFNGYLLKD
jgi:hypothetical protein